MTGYKCPKCSARVIYFAHRSQFECLNGHPFDTSLVADQGENDEGVREAIEPITMTEEEIEQYGSTIRGS